LPALFLAISIWHPLMFVAHPRCAFTSCDALPLVGWVQLVGQISAGWCGPRYGGAKFQRFYSTKIRYFINLKYHPHLLQNPCLVLVFPNIYLSPWVSLSSEGAPFWPPRPNKARRATDCKARTSSACGGGSKLVRCACDAQRSDPYSPRMTILPLTLGVGQMGEVMPAATAIFCPTPVS
jgi:hypothetical protein